MTSHLPKTKAVASHGCYAAIDIGTVTSRLLIAHVDENGIVESRLRMYEITNLGEGVDSEGRLSEEAIVRTASAISTFLAAVSEFNESEEPILGIRAVSTSAARDASNSDALIERLASMGLRLDVIEGSEEAALSFLGATYRLASSSDPAMADVPTRGAASSLPKDRYALVVDVGGGSTELSLGKVSEAQSAPPSAISLNIGCRRMTERFLGEGPYDPQSVEEARTWASSELKRGINRILEGAGLGEGLADDADFQIIAVAGTATSAVTMLRRMAVYDPDQVDGQTVGLAELGSLIRKMSAMTLSQKQHVVGLDPKRAPVIVAGLIILEEVTGLLGKDGFAASDSDILQGIILTESKGRPRAS